LTVVTHERPENDDLRFLYDHQVAEADIVVGRDVGVAEWLAEVLGGKIAAGARSVPLDYARYAAAEAALAWFNGRATVRAVRPISPAMLVGPLLDRLAAEVPGIVHLKLFAQCDAGYLKAALTGNDREPRVEGALDASPSREHEILLNVRALVAPEELRATVEREFGRLDGAVAWQDVECFRPAAPVPYWRE
ncbi:MAG TPA: hypothetical protein VGF49_23850, partial [Candidatus Solibacter sp.]